MAILIFQLVCWGRWGPPPGHERGCARVDRNWRWLRLEIVLAFYASWLAQGAPGVLAQRLRFGFARTLREEPLPRGAADLASLPGQPLVATSASPAL